MFTRPVLLASLILTIGCTSVDSDSVFTSGLYAQVSATADGSGQTLVKTTLFLENPSSLNFIELEGDDVLTAYGPAGDAKIMRESLFLGVVSYSASFDAEDADSEFIVGLSRTIDDSAPDSRVTLPAPFDILNENEGFPFSRSLDDFVVEWAPATSTDDIKYDLTGSCIDDLHGSLTGDPGTLTFAAGDIVKRQGSMVADTCTATVTITRARAGTIDDAYGYGGDAYGYQVRSFDLMTDP